VGITIGVAALLVALSVFNGFSGVVTSVLVGFDPHIRIEKPGRMASSEVADVEKVLRKVPQVVGFAPFVSGKAMLVTKATNKVVYIRGIDEHRIADVSGLQQRIVLGDLRLSSENETPGIAIGLTLADRLGSIVGNELMAISPSGFQSSLSGLHTPQTLKFNVRGIFESNNRDYDVSYAYVSIASAQQLFDCAGLVDGIELRLSDVSQSDDMKHRLAESLPAGYSVSTWYDFHKTLYLVMKIERWSAYVLLSLIVVVAMFNMLGSLTMGVIAKQRDIAILKSMGMTPKRIIRLFMGEGMLIGTAGTALGMLLGGIVLFLQVRYQLFPLDTTVYIIPAIPVEVHWTDILTIAVAALGLSWLTAYYPARRAASTYPAQSLRWE
jgi:lipoprotein-releasing system permease protein